MPAVSRKQQRFFGMVRAAQKGEMENPSPEVAEVAATAKRSSVKKFASTKHKGLPEKKKMNEEGYDHYRDNILMRGGDHRSKETRNRSFTSSKPKSKKKDDGKDTALEKVKADIRKKYGKGAIMGEENLEEKKKGLWDNIHAKRKRGERPARKGEKDYPKTLNVEDVNCDDRKKIVADHGALHKKKSDETGGLPRQVAAKNRVATKQGVDEEAIKEGVMKMVKRAAGIKQKPAKKTTGRDAGAIARKILKDKEHNKYVNFLPANESVGGAVTDTVINDPKVKSELGGVASDAIRSKRNLFRKLRREKPLPPTNEEIDRPYTGPDKKDRAVIKKMDNKKFAAKLADYEKNMDPKKRQALKDKATKGMKFTHEAIKYDSKGSSMDYFLGADPKKTKEYKALKKKKTQKEGTSYGLYKGSGKPGGAMKKFLDKRAKMLQKKRDSQSDAAKNNPHFDSTVPSPSGRNKYEQVSFKDYFTEGNNTARMLHKSKTSVTGNISADRGGDEKKNQASRKGLEKDLKKKGIGYKKGVGKYKYDSGETGTEVSYQTSKPDKMSKRRFGKTMRRLGRKHGQESVITKDKDKPARLHDTESKKPGKSINIGKSKGGSNPSGMGQTSGDKVRSGKLPSKSKKGAYHYG